MSSRPAADETRGSERHPDYLGYVMFAVPPAIAALRYAGVPVNQFVLIPILLASTVFGDAARWKLPRSIWIPLIALFWPPSLPAYGFVRRFNGARAHWSLGILSILSWAAIYAKLFDEGRAFR